MKKIVLFMLSVLVFTSCAKNDFDGTAQEAKEKTFAADFDNTFKVSPAVYANHQWGMNIVPLVDITGSKTRAANENGNQWEDWGYTIPADITPDELEAVLNVFNQKGEASYTSLIDWDEYFVQQVYKGDATYKNHDNQTVTGSEHMDWLCTVTNKHVNVVCWWPYEEAIVVGDNYDDHINNFNNGNNKTEMTSELSGRKFKGITLMKNTNSNVFGFKSSEDNGHVFYNFRMEKINGNYYVGFDFEANGQNKNEQVDRDFIYNDWIVKIVPGKGVTPPVPDIERVRIMCEDLGANVSDFDYNDVVFDIKFIKNGSVYRADIIIQAAGGTLPLYIGGIEVHSLFGVSTGTMVNTYAGRHNEKPTQALTVELPEGNYANAWDAINALPVMVKNPNGQVIQLTVNPGAPAEMIAVPVTTEWSDERVPIQDAYPTFVDWIRDSTIQWWE
jgi:hypothetical protein